MNDTTVSILGCGWLGLPVARRLVEAGYRVKGSTTTPEKCATLRGAGIEPYVVTLDPDLHGEQARDFFDADVLLFDVPPGRRRPHVEAFYRDLVHSVQKELHASPVTYVLFASSTSVYDDLNTTVIESDAWKHTPWRESARALIAAERALMEDRRFDTTIVRLAGLYGYDRPPGRFLAGRTGVANGDAPVNLIHRDDAVEIVVRLIRSDVRGEIFNAVSDEHPTRAEFYTRAAEVLGLEPPVFADEKTTGFKIVSNEKIKRRLDYTFRYPAPMVAAP